MVVFGGYGRPVSTNPYSTPPQKITIGAGTAIKAGFLGAFGVFLFSLIIWLLVGVLALVLAAAGSLDFVARYFQR